MGFVGGGGNIEITTALHTSFCILYCKHQMVYGISISYFLCLPEASVPDVETNLSPRRSDPTDCRQLCSNVRGLAGNLSDLTVASSRCDIRLCSETFVSDMRHVSELLIRGFGRPVLMCRDWKPRVRGIASYV